MEFSVSDLTTADIYKLMTGSIVPRPIAWISSQSARGDVNLAPFSYFNAVSAEPAMIMFSIGKKNSESEKDSLRNILETRVFVVNFVTLDNVNAMNTTAINSPYGVNEFDLAGLTAVPAYTVNVPRVAESPIHFECELADLYRLRANTVVFAEVKHIHIDEHIYLPEYKIDTERYRPVARLAGNNYAGLKEAFTLERPIYKE